MDPKDEKEISHRIITKLDRKEMDFLDTLKKDARFSGGKLTYNDAVKALVDLAMETGVAGKDVSSKESLKEKMFQEVIKHTEEKLSGVDFGALIEATSHKAQEKLLEKKLSEINLKGLAAPRAAHAMRPVRIILWLLIAGLTLTIAGDRMNNGRGVVKVPVISLPGESGFPAGGGCPQNVSKDKERLAHYLKVIKDYILEVKTTIDQTGEGGREYIAEGILSGNIGVGDYVSLANHASSPEYAAFRKVVDSYSDFDTANAGLSGSAFGNLAYDDRYSKVFTYEKMGNSPYPVDYSNETKSFARRAGKDQALRYANLLKARNKAVCVALSTYLTQAEKFFDKLLVWNNPEKKASEVFFTYARKGAEFSYNATKAVRKYKVEQAQAHYDRNNAFYSAYETYYQSCYDSWKKVYEHQIVESRFSYARWVECFQTGIVQTDWDAYAYRLVSTAHEWDGLAETVRITTETADHYDYESTTVGNYYDIASDTRGWRGGFDVAGIMTIITAQYEAQHAPNEQGEGWLVPDDVTEEVLGKASEYHTQYNTSYDGFKKAQAALVKALNDALVQDPRNLYLPVTSLCSAAAEETIDAEPHSALSCYKFLQSGITGFTPRANSAPVPNPGPNLSGILAQTPVTFTLQGSAADAEGDSMNYRWVLTSIPDGGEAKSATYVWYQPLSAAQVATLTPDLAGAWQATLEVNDSQVENEASVNVNVIRHIFWISHSDKQTDLELYGSYYLEKAHESANVYMNFDDNGKPVDLDGTYQPSVPGVVFHIKAQATGGIKAKGIYDGTLGSTFLLGGLARDRGDFPLKSASNKSTKVSIYIYDVDRLITQLVLPSDTCAYGNKLPSGVLQGSYYVKQWVDNATWCNQDNRGFQKEKDIVLKGPEVPDWMEARAADTLNVNSGYLRYVMYIGVTNDMNEYGNYKPSFFGSSTVIYLNPNFDEMRYNMPKVNGYGFFSEACLDACAMHESYHAFIFGNSHTLSDRDNDRIAGDNISGMIDYAWDSKDNQYGKYGPERIKTSGLAIPTSIKYSGDGTQDGNMREKEFIEKFPLSGLAQNSVKVIDLPRNIPISGVSFITAAVVSADGKYVFAKFQKNYSYSYSINYKRDSLGKRDLTSPVLIVTLDAASIMSTVGTSEIIGHLAGYESKDAIILFDYKITTPFAPVEYDASERQPGRYTGIWNGNWKI